MPQDSARHEASGPATELSRRYATLIELSRHMVSILDLQRLEDYIVEQAVDLLGGDDGSLMLYDEDSNTLKVHAACAPESAKASRARGSRNKGLAEDVAKGGSPVVLMGDLHQDSRFPTGGTRDDVKAAVSAPLRINDDVLGVLNVNIVQRDAGFTQADADFLGTLANNAAVAIQNARLYRQLGAAYDDLKRVQDQLSALFEGASDTILTGDPDVRDIGRREKLEERLRRTERMRLVGLLSSGMAHQFNNLFGGILGIAQLLLREAKDERLARMLKMIEESSAAGAETVQKMHEFAQVAGDPGFESLDIKQALERAVQLVKAHPPSGTDAASIHVQIAHEDDRPMRVRGNPADLTDVFRYIFENAFEACADRGTILVQTKRADGGACVQIEDDGRGMSEDTLTNAFQPFFSTKGSAGVGVGLSVAYGIVHRHRGDITIDSRERESTVVHVTIPLAELPEQTPSRHLSAHAKGSHARVLAVDDERIIREVLCQMLGKAGHEVVPAASGKEAVEQLRKQDFDIVFTDYDMPAMSGERLADKAKSIQPSVVVVLITGWGSTIDEDEIQRSAVDFVLSKPFRETAIKAVVAAALDQRGASDSQTR